MTKNLPANAGDSDSILDPEGSYRPVCVATPEPVLRSLGTATTEPKCLSYGSLGARGPVLHKRRHQKPAHRKEEQPPLTATREKPVEQ